MGIFDGWGDAISGLFGGGGGDLSSYVEPSNISNVGSTAADFGAGSSGGFDWGSLGKGFAGALGGAAASLGGKGAELGFNALFPGKAAGHQLVDTRQDVTRTGGNMALDRAKTLQQNPNSFGLPGDVNDPSTPAGAKMYGITKRSRDADAARGGLNTGGSAARENRAVNETVGNEYNKIWQDSMSTLQGQQPMAGYRTDAEANPWGQILGSTANPLVSKGISALLSNWGMNA